MLAFIAGVALGGLLNVIIYRLPRLWPVPDTPSKQGEQIIAPMQQGGPLPALTDAIPQSAGAEQGGPPPAPTDAIPQPAVVEQGGPPPAPTDAVSQSAMVEQAVGIQEEAPPFPITQNSKLKTQNSTLRCTRSGEPLGWGDSVPLLGWLGQRGRCRHCGKRLPLSFPIIELGTGLALAAAWIDYGLGPLFFIYSIFTLVLIVTLTIDWQHHDLYTIVLLAGAALALLGALFSPEVGLSSALLGGAVGGGTLLFFYFIARLVYGGESEALAFGDVELAVMLGLMLGYPTILGPLLLGPLIAGLIGLMLVLVRAKRMHDYVPVGASFCFAAICALLLRDQLWRTLPLDNLTYWLGVLGDDIRNWLGSFISSR